MAGRPSGRGAWRRILAALGTWVGWGGKHLAPSDAGASTDPYRALGWSLFRLRWATLAALLLVTLTQPVRNRLGYVLESNILLFAAYNLCIYLIWNRLSALRSFIWISILDLPVALALYALGAAPGGLLFVLVFLAVVCAAARMSLAGSFLYAAIAAVLLIVIDPTLPLWSGEVGDVRRLSGRIIILGLTTLGTAILTQRLRLEQVAAQTSRDEAERLTELARMRADFVAGISHDLRTPLTGARAGMGMLEASIHDRLRPDEQELIGSTRRNIERLGRLIDDLLVLNQLDAHVLRLTRAPLDLRAVITEALPMLHALLSAKRQTLEVELPEPLLIQGDARRLEQVVMNLVANANQHTPRDTFITITGHATPGSLRLAVSDTGPGIPTAELEKIFDRFYRLGTGRGNSGLGLAIVKGIVELHGGRVWAENGPESGAVFHVVLPRYQPQEEEYGA